LFSVEYNVHSLLVLPKHISIIFASLLFMLIATMICTCFTVGRLQLNRQVIVLMSGLGVPDKAFFALQDDMLQRLADMLIRESSAVDALAQVKS